MSSEERDVVERNGCCFIIDGKQKTELWDGVTIVSQWMRVVCREMRSTTKNKKKREIRIKLEDGL